MIGMVRKAEEAVIRAVSNSRPRPELDHDCSSPHSGPEHRELDASKRHLEQLVCQRSSVVTTTTASFALKNRLRLLALLFFRRLGDTQRTSVIPNPAIQRIQCTAVRQLFDSLYLFLIGRIVP